MKLAVYCLTNTQTMVPNNYCFGGKIFTIEADVAFKKSLVRFVKLMREICISPYNFPAYELEIDYNDRGRHNNVFISKHVTYGR